MCNTHILIICVLHFTCIISEAQFTFNNVIIQAYVSKSSSANVIVINRESETPNILTDYIAISIENQTIPKVYTGSFVNLPKLAYLELISNEIRDVEAEAFQRLPKLNVLDISKNKLKKLREKVFNNLNISGLLLGNNEIEDVDTRTFDNLPKLRYLDLSNNKIKHVNNKWFKNTPKLTEIRLDFNYIFQLPERAFQNLKTVSEEYYFNNRYPTISISNNKITYIHPGAFYGLEEIWHLRLDHNKITNIEDNVFDGVYKIHHLDVSDNKIKCLSEVMLETIKRTVTLDLLGNSFSKDCVQKLLEWSREAHVKVKV